MVRDPVCGMELDEKTAAYKSIPANNVYYFCSATCQNEFNKSSEKYLQASKTTRHAGHYGGYCRINRCGTHAKSSAWYFYIGLLFLILLLVLLIR